ncbi:hypothetical protein CONCODRAFT_80428 [Conidiobolus coronatus NRRL 28638]|uniref:Tctex-1 n=1 Tax=Conidiobolus coronatus (strain ATCC 28846 / CBS 209.66 / NRRL 28638) TaxID=796925 RepID=A0A137NV12_CONC2|nr:hypothetical protein CONCODRAFT_80428 [Conidiobolus coronatus NRRL 28638]|eukprot:KXN66653.1 hypothetical protein CONCODRAFT_80428 [Conidiobolus coronatus NRRL 28638]
MTEIDIGEYKRIEEDEVKKIIKQIINTYIKGSRYQHSVLKEWQERILNNSTEKLKDLYPKTKFIITSTIMQHTEHGYHQASTCYWDKEKDQLISYVHQDQDFVILVNVVCSPL